MESLNEGECLYPKAFGIVNMNYLGRLDVGHQKEGFLIVITPPGDGVHRSVLFAAEQDSRGEKSSPLTLYGIVSSNRKGSP
jgi:hypothetical protein